VTRQPSAPRRASRRAITVFALISWAAPATGALLAGDVVVELTNGGKVTFVGAVDRWDADGNPRRMVNPKAKIDAPEVDAVAVQTRPGTWTFADLPPGRYDLVILARERIRIEGFGFPPVREFDPFIALPDQSPAAARRWITADIAKSTYYENKVTPLSFAGNDKQIRLLVQLLRDKPTRFDSQFGEPVATIRHEVWEYDQRFGAWSKEKRTRVFDRVLMAKRELRTWTWVWDPGLGHVQVGPSATTVRYTLPASFSPAKQVGLLPY